ncbi:MAG: hypothetical protein JXA92_02970 [candidate division Zixibacteria bacterium]|nr:hypothetical protein [candidate division Zixibacteria bacterium]
MLKQTRVFFVFFSLLIILSLFWGCDDNPLAPENETDKDYIAYTYEGINHQYFEYHPLTGIIDSFTCEDGPTWKLEASADGKYLFVATSDYVAKVDIKTKETVETLPNRAKNGIAISPDNKLIAFLMGPGIVIVRLSDFSVIYEDSLIDLRSGSFSYDSKRLFGRDNSLYNAIIIMDIDDNFSTTTKELPVGPIKVIKPSLDETKYFLIWQYDMWSNIYSVYDIILDSIIFKEQIWGGLVDLLTSPNGKYVFYTEAGDYSDIPGSNYFTIYDIAKNRIKMKISTLGIEDGINPTYMALGAMCITPDSKWLIINQARNYPAFIRFNLNTMEIDDYFKYGQSGSIGGFTCQLIE